MVATHASRLVDLATIDGFQGDDAATELERVVDVLEFRAVVIDAPEALSFPTVASERQIPLFAHLMSLERLSSELRSAGNWGRALARRTASAASLFSLIASGLLDELRGLHLVFAWLGGGALPVAGTVPGSYRLRRDTPEDVR